MSTDFPYSSQPLTVASDGTPPKNRFTDAAALCSCYRELVMETLPDDARLSDIRSNYDGMPPTLGDISEQQFQNAGDLPNINRREFTTKIDTYTDNWSAIDKGGEHFADVRLKAKYFQSPIQKAQAEAQATAFFNEALFEWNPDCNTIADYVLESGSRNTQMALFGIGIAYFKDSKDWRWMMIPTRSVKVPNGTKVTLRNMSVIFVNRTYTATELWECRNRDGWNEEVIIEYLWRRLAENQPGTTIRIPIAEWENRIRNNELFFQRDFRQVYLIECYVQEFNEEQDKNGVSKYVISENGPNDVGDECGFLYEKDREFPCIQNVMVAFIDRPGPENDWHGVKGYGDHLFDICHFNNLFDNHISTMGLITSTPMFEADTQEERQKLSQIVWSRMGVLFPGLKLAQTKVESDLNGCMNILESHVRLLNENSRSYPIGETINQQEKTATQTTFDRQDQAQLTSSQIDTYRCQGLDQLFTEMFRRLAAPNYPKAYPGGRAASNFLEKCASNGIPIQAIRDPQRIMASRSGGTGNSMLDAQHAQAIMQVATPGQGQQEAKKAYVAALSGYDQVARFIQDVPPTDQNDVEVTYEHALLTLGQVIQAFGQQDHIKHLGVPDPQSPTHLGLLASSRQAAMMLQKQGLQTNLQDAQKLSRVMDATLQHCGMHLQFIQQVPMLKQMAQQMQQVLGTFAHFVQAFDQNVQSIAQQQQGGQPQLSAEDQIKMDKWNVEKAGLLEKHQLQLQLMQSETQQKLGAMAVEHNARTMHKDAEFNQKLGQEAVKTNVQNQMTLTQQHLDAQDQVRQSTLDLTTQALQHNQGVVHSHETHQQDLAQTRAKHNQELAQQAEAAQAQPSQPAQPAAPTQP